eukprot:4596975-Pyramimonas_sp.AAC.1
MWEEGGGHRFALGYSTLNISRISAQFSCARSQNCAMRAVRAWPTCTGTWIPQTAGWRVNADARCTASTFESPCQHDGTS